jgi:hypothetical protein
VKVWDVTYAIYEDLQKLSMQRYMGAMWMLGTELISLYADEMSAPERSLAEATLALTHAVGSTGDVVRYERQASGLADEWLRLIDEVGKTGSGGLARTNITFKAIAAEIASLVQLYYAAEWVADAGVLRWRVPTAKGYRVDDPEEEVAEDSPIGQTLARFERIVSGVARVPDWDGDLAMRLIRNFDD